jgi:hypothetical protein
LVPDIKVDITKEVAVEKPAAEGSAASLSPLKHSSSSHDIPNEALINKLLESLEALKTHDSRANSGTVSPSPLTVSTGSSADPIPSSPTEDIYDFR